MARPILKAVPPAHDLDGVFEELHPASFGWALACCRWDRDEAEEVLQIAYLKTLDGRARFNGDAALRTWFFGVVKKTAQERRRKRTLRNLALLRWARGGGSESDQPVTPERAAGAVESRRRLRRCLLRLSERQRDLLQLVFYHELTIEEAADVLSLPVGTARTHYARGKSRLRALLQREGTL